MSTNPRKRLSLGKNRRKIQISLSLTILAFALIIKVMNFSLIEQAQLKVFDAFQQYFPRQYVDQPVKIIDIDDESLERIGQWPWPRSKISELVDRLGEYNPSAVGFDILFAEPDRTSPSQIIPLWQQDSKLPDSFKNFPDHDEMLAEAMSERNIVTSFMLNHEKIIRSPALKSGFSYAGPDPKSALPEYSGAVTSLPLLEQKAKGNGAINSRPDSDGIIRRMPVALSLGEAIYPTFAMELLRVAQGASGYIIKSTGASGEAAFGRDSAVISAKVGQFIIPTNADGEFWIHFTKYNKDRYIPVWKVLNGAVDREMLEGSIILVGTSAAGLKDVRATPLNPVISGVEIHAQAIEQVLGGDFLFRPDWLPGAEIVLMLLIGLFLIIMMSYLPVIWAAMFMAVSLVSAGAFSLYAFKTYGLLIDPITPSIAMLFLYLSELLMRFLNAEHEKRQIRSVFSLYMSPALVDELAANPEKLTLGGETRNITVLFTDIRGFTTFSENMKAEDLTDFMNSFLTPMSDVILENNGTIDKFIGDSIMAFWNAPLDDAAHAMHACRSSLGMLDELAAFNDRQFALAEQRGGGFTPVVIGIGLNTGYCCVGNMGSEQRFDYSVLGNDVNLASRLEGLCKYYNLSIIISESTKEKAPGLATIEIDIVRVSGKTQPTRIFALLGDEKFNDRQDFGKFAGDFSYMVRAYRDQNWAKAMGHLRNAEKSAKTLKSINLFTVFSIYEERIEAFRQTPPPDDWDGVFEVVGS